jgi:NADPH:quinone reductase-like Zn-dependent oxidoreductase
VRSIRIHDFSGLAGITLDDVPLPETAAGQILIRVVAASVNPADIKIAKGFFPRVKQCDLPVTLGCDFSGVVEHRGQRSARFRDGDFVFGMARLGHGSFSDYIAADVGAVAPAPNAMDLKDAAAVPLAALTAWQGLTLHGSLAPGQRVLILGAGGGVGHFAVQFARHLGAEVYAMGAAQDAYFLRELGADRVLDRDSAFEKTENKMNLVLDLVGGSTQDRSWAVLKENGIIVSPVSQPDERHRTAAGGPGRRYLAQANRADLERISSLLETGDVRPVISSRFGLDDAYKALTQLDRGGTRGKSVLTCEADF